MCEELEKLLHEEIFKCHRQFPGIKWAQRKEQVFLTIELQDTENPQIDLTDEGVLTFR